MTTMVMEIAMVMVEVTLQSHGPYHDRGRGRVAAVLVVLVLALLTTPVVPLPAVDCSCLAGMRTTENSACPNHHYPYYY